MTIYAATSNKGKLAEFAASASGDGVDVLALPGLAEMAEPVEDADTFIGNAELKARAYSLLAPGLVVMADDSGLCVDALGGAPGVRSARFAEDQGWGGAATESTPPFREERERMGHPGSPAGHAGSVADHPGSLAGHSGSVAGHPGSLAGHAGDVNARNNACLLAMLRERGSRGSAAQFRCALAVARDGEVLLRTEGECAGVMLAEPRGAGGFGYDPLFLVPEFGRSMAELTQAEKWSVSHRGRAFRELLRLTRDWR